MLPVSGDSELRASSSRWRVALISIRPSSEGGAGGDVVVGPPTVIQVAVGARHACWVYSDGQMACSGNNQYGQLGYVATGSCASFCGGACSQFPRFVPDVTDAVSVAASADSTCIIRRSGALWCFGANNYGQLGDGTNTPRAFPTPVRGLANVTQVGLGTRHGCALTADGTAHCWTLGFNIGFGPSALEVNGSGDASQHALPVTVVTAGGAPLVNITEISVGAYHSCAIAGGLVYCWGANNVGQLGTANTVPAGVATAVPMSLLSNVAHIAAGDSHTCAVTMDHRVFCWGANNEGQIGGTPDSGAHAAPMMRPALTGTPTGIYAGGNRTCAVFADETARCWGEFASGALGDNGMTTMSTRGGPVPLLEPSLAPLAGVRQIALGHAASYGSACGANALSGCALTAGDVSCWGDSGTGQSGTGMSTALMVATPTLSPRAGTAPPSVAPQLTALQVAPGGAHTCALLIDRTVSCWGLGKRGAARGTGPLGITWRPRRCGSWD